MKKPKIIIASTDFSYIVAIQNKFIYELFDEIDLLVITENKIFDQFVKNENKAELIIVEDKLLIKEIDYELFEHIVVIRDDDTVFCNNDPKIKYYNKRVSINILFNSIIKELSNCFSIEKKVKQIKSKVIAVVSAKGGVGKTTIAMGLCSSLVNEFQKVLYINASNLQSCQINAGDFKYAPIELSEKIKNCEKESIFNIVKPYIIENCFSYLPPFKMPLYKIGLSKEIYYDVVRMANKSKEYDYIILDIENTIDSYFEELINISNKVIVIMDPSENSTMATELLFEIFPDNLNKKGMLICNRMHINSFEKDDFFTKYHGDKECIFESNELIDLKTIDSIKNSNGIFKKLLLKIDY